MYIHILLMYYTRAESAWYGAEEEINGYHLVVHLLIIYLTIPYLTYHQHSATTATTTIDRRTVWHREFLRFVSFASESAFFHDHLTLIPVKNICLIIRSRMKREET